LASGEDLRAASHRAWQRGRQRPSWDSVWLPLSAYSHKSDQPIDNQPRDRDRGDCDESIQTPSPNFGIGQVLIEILRTSREICDGVCACIKAPIGQAVEDVLRQKDAHYGPNHRGDDSDPLPIDAQIGIPTRWVRCSLSEPAVLRFAMMTQLRI